MRFMCAHGNPAEKDRVLDEDQRLNGLVAICARFGVESIYAFGSLADQVAAWLRGELASLPESPQDVDIGVRTSDKLDVHDKVRLAISLEDHFDVFRVDLVCLVDADPFVAANIVRGQRLYETDPHAGAEYELYVLRRAADLIPLEEERTALILDRGP